MVQTEELQDKKKIFKEIKDTIRFLIRERQKGKESFEVKDFFNDSLQENIIENFDNKITREEYESVIMEMFGLKKISKETSLTRSKLEQEIEEIILKYKIKSKKIIIQKIVGAVSDSDFNYKQIVEIVNSKYNEVVGDIIRGRLKQFPSNRLPELKKFSAIFKKENYDIHEDLIENIYKKVKTDSKKSEKTVVETEEVVSIDPLKPDKSVEEGKKDVKSEIEDLRKQRILEQIEQRQKNKKQRFINLYTKTFKFTYKGEETEDEKTYLIYAGSFQGRYVYIKVYKPKNKIENIIILFNYEIKKKRYSILIDLNEFIKLKEAHNEKLYIQSRIKSVGTFFGFGGFHDALWFLEEIFQKDHGVPKYIFDHLEVTLIQYIAELDATLSKFLAYKALK